MFGNNSYTGKDITAIREEIIEFMKQSDSNWSDYNESSVQMEYAEMLAGVADMLCYYLDSQALETFLSTARQSKNINSILNQMNYKYTLVGASKGNITFHRTPTEADEEGNPIYLKDRLMIPKFLEVFSTDDQVPRFLVCEDCAMQSDEIEKSVSVVQGVVVEKYFDVSLLQNSFKLYFSEEPVDVGYVEILNDGYVKVEDAFVEIQGGCKYSVHHDTSGYAYILFTYDWKKYLPKEGSIGVRYIKSDGESGNIVSGKLNRYVSNNIINIDTGEFDNSLTVINDLATYGGFSSSDVDLNLHKANAKNWFKCHGTIVTLLDFETMIRQNSWVKDCVCFDWRKDDTIVDRPYYLKAWVVPITGKETDSRQYEELTAELQKSTVFMSTVSVVQAEFVDLNLEFNISLSGTLESNREELRDRIEKEIYSWYSWEYYMLGDSRSRVEFGMSIDLNRLKYNVMGLSNAVTNVECSLEDDLYLTKVQFPYCTSVVVNLV